MEFTLGDSHLILSGPSCPQGILGVMKKVRASVAWMIGVILVLGFVACVVVGLCDQKGGRGGRMFIQMPR
jgi:hypothetical protein